MFFLLFIETASVREGGRAVHPINWKSKYGGMDVSEAKRLRALEDENAKLKKLLAESMLDAAALRELLSKKW
jgi:putative transposase